MGNVLFQMYGTTPDNAGFFVAGVYLQKLIRIPTQSEKII